MSCKNDNVDEILEENKMEEGKMSKVGEILKESKMSDIDKLLDDNYLNPGPTAFSLYEGLKPIGRTKIVRPPTFIKDKEEKDDKKNKKGFYNISFTSPDNNICTVDTEQSQNNRVEPIYMEVGYEGLVRKIEIKYDVNGDTRIIKNLLDVPHRIFDALVKCSGLQGEVENFLQDLKKGNWEPFAKLAATSILFGAWNSRGTGEKICGIFDSNILAFNVSSPLDGRYQYSPPIDYRNEGLIANKSKKLLSSKGLLPVPGHKLCGVYVNGHIERNATIHLATLRLLRALNEDGTLNEDRTKILQRYILGLALVAITHPTAGICRLRKGCHVVTDFNNNPRKFFLTYPNGEEKEFNILHSEALNYAGAAAKDFGIEEEKEFTLTKEQVDKYLKIKNDSSDED